ncbi:hypothetical protein Cob_v006006 [Colletotrichum orbiculare MAFF 240422]|uniref:Uncharacterized protein n=1 Tax=Colletotrichum orbiculare (strain 104-T / ATCC 96160 / CBS 514.97 / LARS 414 / MAFF 240422) TaxID=1213857 RepID=A0A484FTW4_COLOR|nr:hypothetical protein Cob_v006006 [Colletotrichum orbiculare MAFF 240422]
MVCAGPTSRSLIRITHPVARSLSAGREERTQWLARPTLPTAGPQRANSFLLRSRATRSAQQKYTQVIWHMICLFMTPLFEQPDQGTSQYPGPRPTYGVADSLVTTAPRAIHTYGVRRMQPTGFRALCSYSSSFVGPISCSRIGGVYIAITEWEWLAGRRAWF